MPQTIDNLSVTWANSLTTFTAFKFNAIDNASAAGSLLMDLQVGGSSKFKVGKDGSVYGTLIGSSTATLGISSSVGFGFYSTNRISVLAGGQVAMFYGQGENIIANGRSLVFSSDASGSGDLFLTRRAAANLRLGAADTTGTTAPTPQTLSVQSWTSSTNNNQPGANFTIAGSQGTGTGAGGSIVFQVAPAGSSGTAQNALVDALTIDSARNVTAGNVFISPNTSVSVPMLQAAANGGFFAGVYSSQYAIELGMAATAGGAISNTYGSLKYSIAAKLLQLGAGSSAGVSLIVDAANTLALRNGAAAQNFNVYNTHTSSTNYEAINIGWDSNNAYIGAAIGSGGGTRRPLRLFGSEVDFLIGTTTVSRIWLMNSSGHFLAGSDNIYDIGTSSGSRPRTGYFGTSVITPTLQIGSSANQTITSSTNTLNVNVGGGLALQITSSKWAFGLWQGGNGSYIASTGPFGGVTNRAADPLIITCEGGSGDASSGYIQLRAAPPTTSGTAAHVDEEALRIAVPSTGTPFVSFGGTTSSFPALKRSSTTLQARLADDSGFASVQGKLTTDTAYTAGDPTTTGYLVVYDSAGVAYKIPAVAV